MEAGMRAAQEVMAQQAMVQMRGGVQ
jgi:hypothetical protein